MNMELRVQSSELVSNDDGTMTVSGYVNKTGKLSNILGQTKRFKEKISKGAFSLAIQNATRDIDFLAEHNGKLILASTRNSSLQLREDEQGLFMSATISPTSWGKDYYQLIKDGILQNMSFGFRTVKDSWKLIEPGLYERTIDQLELFEVSVVRDPAYSQSTIAARGIDLVEDVEIPAEIEEENREMENKLNEILEELRSAKEQIETLAAEVRELKTPEVKDQEPEEQEKEPEERAEDPEEKPSDIPVVEPEEPAQEEQKQEQDEQEVKDPEPQPEPEEEKEEEAERSADVTAENAELRRLLDSLK